MPHPRRRAKHEPRVRWLVAPALGTERRQPAAAAPIGIDRDLKFRQQLDRSTTFMQWLQRDPGVTQDHPPERAVIGRRQPGRGARPLQPDLSRPFAERAVAPVRALPDPVAVASFELAGESRDDVETAGADLLQHRRIELCDKKAARRAKAASKATSRI